jgi:hypothetical protein
MLIACSGAMRLIPDLALPPSSASGVLPHLHARVAVEPQGLFGGFQLFPFRGLDT